MITKASSARIRTASRLLRIRSRVGGSNWPMPGNAASLSPFPGSGSALGPAPPAHRLAPSPPTAASGGPYPPAGFTLGGEPQYPPRPSAILLPLLPPSDVGAHSSKDSTSQSKTRHRRKTSDRRGLRRPCSMERTHFVGRWAALVRASCVRDLISRSCLIRLGEMRCSMVQTLPRHNCDRNRWQRRHGVCLRL
jgi:hypothetical protein